MEVKDLSAISALQVLRDRWLAGKSTKADKCLDDTGIQATVDNMTSIYFKK
jgi:hypothetical protein